MKSSHPQQAVKHYQEVGWFGKVERLRSFLKTGRKESPMVQFMTPKDIAFINNRIEDLMKERIQVDLTEVKEEGQRVEKEEKKKNAKEEKGKGKEKDEKDDIQFLKKVVPLEVIEDCLSFLGKLDLEPHLGGKQRTLSKDEFNQLPEEIRNLLEASPRRSNVSYLALVCIYDFPICLTFGCILICFSGRRAGTSF